jgi:hypothetical protein
MPKFFGNMLKSLDSQTSLGSAILGAPHHSDGQIAT